jgi:hypothetical protein
MGTKSSWPIPYSFRPYLEPLTTKMDRHKGYDDYKKIVTIIKRIWHVGHVINFAYVSFLGVALWLHVTFSTQFELTERLIHLIWHVGPAQLASCRPNLLLGCYCPILGLLPPWPNYWAPTKRPNLHGPLSARSGSPLILAKGNMCGDSNSRPSSPLSAHLTNKLEKCLW